MPYVETEPGDLDDSSAGRLLRVQRERMNEEALTAEDLRIAKLVHGVVEAEINAHVKRLEAAIHGVSMSEEERAWVRLAIKREARIEQFRSAVIEKTIAGLVWSGLIGIAYAVWEYVRSSLRS